MKRTLLITAVTALIAVTGVQAAPTFDPNINPFQNYAIYRILPNGNENLLGTFLVNDGWTNESIIRQTALAAARQNRTNNPAWRIIIYGPIDPPETWYTDDDRIWDSAVSG